MYDVSLIYILGRRVSIPFFTILLEDECLLMTLSEKDFPFLSFCLLLSSLSLPVRVSVGIVKEEFCILGVAINWHLLFSAN